jgi:hypothetical protein
MISPSRESISETNSSEVLSEKVEPVFSLLESFRVCEFIDKYSKNQVGLQGL